MQYIYICSAIIVINAVVLVSDLVST
jgi:hypothetical protein